jgi:hypothetical protein
MLKIKVLHRYVKPRSWADEIGLVAAVWAKRLLIAVNTALTLSDPMPDLILHYDFPVLDAFPHVVRTLANR